MQRIVAKVWVVIPVVLFLIQGIGVGVNSYMLLSVIALTPIVLLFCRNNSDILKDYFPILVFIFLLFLGMLYRDFPVKIPSIVFFVGITGLLLTFFGNIVFSKRKLNIFRSPQYLGLIVIVSLFVGLAIFSLKNVPVFDSVDYYCRLQSIASSWNSVDNYNSYYLVGHMASGMSIAYLPGAILFPTNPILKST